MSEAIAVTGIIRVFIHHEIAAPFGFIARTSWSDDEEGVFLAIIDDLLMGTCHSHRLGGHPLCIIRIGVEVDEAVILKIGPEVPALVRVARGCLRLSVAAHRCYGKLISHSSEAPVVLKRVACQKRVIVDVGVGLICCYLVTGDPIHAYGRCQRI